MTGRIAVRVTLSLAACAFAGLGFGPAFGGFPGPRTFLVALGAVTIVAAVVAFCAALIPRLPSVVAALAGTVLVVGAAMTATDSYRDLHHGPMQLLTGGLPTEAAGAQLGAVTVLIGWSALAAGLLAAYGSHPLLPLAPVLVCLLLALSLGATGKPLPAWFALVLLAAVVALLVTGGPATPSPVVTGRPAALSPVVTGRPTALSPAEARNPVASSPAEAGRIAGRSGGPSPAVAGVAALIALAAIGVAALAGPIAPGVGARPPADLRNLVSAPITPRSGVSPLQQFLALRNGIRPIKLAGTTSRPGSLLRMATLTRFNGLFWTVDGDYRRASTILAQPRVTTTNRVTVTQQITVEAGELDWIPAAGRATSISVPGLGVDEATGDLAVPAGTIPPAAYTATSTVNQADFEEVLAADPVTIPKPGKPLPPTLASFLDTTVSGQPSGSDELLALYKRFTGDQFKHDQSTEAPGGHGFVHIQRLLDTGRGTSEQYASAYAVFARYLGYDARVVMGFRPRYNEQAFIATGADVDAWVEVNFTGIGWIAIDPSPRGNPEGTRPDAPPAQSRASTIDDPLKAGPRNPPPGSPETPPTDHGAPVAAPNAGAANPLAIASLSLTAVLVLLAATPIAKSAQRIRRRRRASDRHAVVGAWHDVLDRLREAGIRVDATHTSGDVIRVAGRANPSLAHPLLLPALAHVTDHAAYAPEGPQKAARRQAWVIAADIRGAVHAAMSPARRLRALLDPRSLLWRPPIG